MFGVEQWCQDQSNLFLDWYLSDSAFSPTVSLTVLFLFQVCFFAAAGCFVSSGKEWGRSAQAYFTLSRDRPALAAGWAGRGACNLFAVSGVLVSAEAHSSRHPVFSFSFLFSLFQVSLFFSALSGFEIRSSSQSRAVHGRYNVQLTYM